jgi:chromate transporter
VVGVIANLSLWFALHVIFGRISRIDAGPVHMIWPDLTSLRPVSLAIGVAAAWLLLGRHWNLVLVLVLAALASVVLTGGR